MLEVFKTIEIIEKLINFYNRNELFRLLVRFVFKLDSISKIALIFSIVIFSISIISIRKIVDKQIEFARILEESEIISRSNKQSRYGIESLLFSGMKENNIKERIGNMEINDHFISIIDDLLSLKVNNVTKNFINDLYIDKSYNNLIFKNFTNKKSFLYFHKDILRQFFSENEWKNSVNNQSYFTRVVNKKLNNDQRLKHSLLIMTKIDSVLSSSFSSSLFKNQQSCIDFSPIQTYCISPENLAIIQNEDKHDNASVHYMKYFDKSKMKTFTNSPNYESTISSRKYKFDAYSKENAVNSQLVSENFLISSPYFDITGNGLIVTLSRSIKYEGNFITIFLDFHLSDKYADSVLVENIKANFAGGFKNSFIIDFDNSSEAKVIKDTYLPINGNSILFNIFLNFLNLFNDKIIVNHDYVSNEIVNNLKYINDNHKYLKGVNSFVINKQKFFSVPLHSRNSDGQVKLKLIIFWLDNYLVEFVNDLIFYSSIVSLVSIFVIMFAFIAKYIRRINSHLQNWKNMKSFYNDINLPVCYLDSEFNIIDSNNSFKIRFNLTDQDHNNKFNIKRIIAKDSFPFYEEMKVKFKNNKDQKGYLMIAKDYDGLDLGLRNNIYLVKQYAYKSDFVEIPFAVGFVSHAYEH